MRLKFWIEYLLIKAIDAALRLLSWESASDLGAAMGSAASWVARKRWRLTLLNLDQAFPEKSPQERRLIAKEAWRNFGRIAAEIVKSRHLSKEEVLGIVRFEGREVLDGALAEGKGVIINTGHFGNWEFAGTAIAVHGYRLGVVGRLMKNPLVDVWLKETRCRFGLSLFAHRNPFAQSVRWLKSGNLLGLMIDHNIRQGGMFVPFFGRPAATSTLSALLSVRLGCPVVTVRIRREGYRIVLTFCQALHADPGADPQGEVERLTVALIRSLEDIIRQRPGEWLWGHNRWKRTPTAALPEISSRVQEQPR